MRPAFFRPLTLDEALRLKGRHGAEAHCLAGGTDLMLALRSGKRKQGHLVALCGAGLAGIVVEPGAVGIGAMTTMAEIASSPLVRRACPALARAASLVGSPQIRNVATIGGNIANASPAADTAPALIAAGAVVKVASARGERSVEAHAFFLGPGRTALEPDELVVAVSVPAAPSGALDAFHKYGSRRANVISPACCAVRFELDAGRIARPSVAFGGVAPTPVRGASCSAFLTGLAPAEALAGRALDEAVLADVRPISDVRGSAVFKAALCAAAVRQAVEAMR